MKIISTPDMPGLSPTEITCHWCGTVFVAESTQDAHSVTVEKSGRGVVYRKYVFLCPTCGSQNYVDVGKPPIKLLTAGERFQRFIFGEFDDHGHSIWPDPE